MSNFPILSYQPILKVKLSHSPIQNIPTLKVTQKLSSLAVLSDIEARGKQVEDDRDKLSQFVAGHTQTVKITGAKISENLLKAESSIQIYNATGFISSEAQFVVCMDFKSANLWTSRRIEFSNKSIC